LLKEIIIAFQSYVKAHHFISKHKIWKWILIPGILYTILFCVGFYFFWTTANGAARDLSNFLHVTGFLQHQHSDTLNFLFIMSAIMVHLTLFFFYFSLFKYLFLIIGAPLFAYLSQQTEALINGQKDDFAFDRALMLQDMRRGIRVALRNVTWQTVYTICILILSFIPIIGWITPVICTFVECYYYGFSMLDYSCQRHKLSQPTSLNFISQHKGLAIGNGIMFYGMHLVPILGWVLAPAYAVIAATISLYHQNLE
jgi:CysZ protein